jgi:hypothetical protein
MGQALCGDIEATISGGPLGGCRVLRCE